MHAVAEDMAPTNLLQINNPARDLATMTKPTNSDDDLYWQAYQLTRSSITQQPKEMRYIRKTLIFERGDCIAYMDIFKIIAWTLQRNYW